MELHREGKAGLPVGPGWCSGAPPVPSSPPGKGTQASLPRILTGEGVGSPPLGVWRPHCAWLRVVHQSHEQGQPVSPAQPPPPRTGQCQRGGCGEECGSRGGRLPPDSRNPWRQRQS